MEPAQWEHDACGVGLLADRRARASHEWITRALEALVRLTHRGASGDGHGSADGAGLLTAIPWELLGVDLPAVFAEPSEARALGLCFLPAAEASEARRVIADALEDEGWDQLAWREVPHDRSVLGASERDACPAIWQVAALHQASPQWSEAGLERSLYRARVIAERQLAGRGFGAAAIVSLSRRTVVYKALVAPVDLARFYPDLTDWRCTTTFAVLHQRFSTNTFPQWALAQPFRVLAHNGEINTVLGNRLQARRRQADQAAHAGSVAESGELVRLAGSDSQSLDDMIELLRQGGLSLAHAFARVIPRAWEHDPRLPARERAFDAYQSAICEPWEGPAALAFADGQQAGALLDRNGFRPLRVLTSRDGLVTVGSETGIFDIPESQVETRGRLGPGEMLLVDLATGRLLENSGLRRALAAQQPYREWVERTIVPLPGRFPSERHALGLDRAELRLRQRAFGYTAEEIELIVRPMAEEGKEAVGSMGDDTPLAVLSTRRRLLPDYFRQRFAQVTNPPIDPLRERLVMSLRTLLGRGGRLLDEGALDARLIELSTPVLSDAECAELAGVEDRPAAHIDTTYAIGEGERAFEAALERVQDEAVAAVRRGAVLLIASDRKTNAERAPLPALLVTGATSQALDRARLGTRAGLVVDTGEVRDAHQAAVLLAFGAGAVCPWLALASARALGGGTAQTARACEDRFRHALEQGLLKVLSKMGVCTIAAYRGSHLMEAVGLDRALLDRFFPDTAAVAGGLTLAALMAESVAWHRTAAGGAGDALPHPGFHGYRRDGEYHAYHPAMVKAFHHAVASGAAEAYTRFAMLVRERPAVAVRDLLRFKPQAAIPLDAVEPAELILRRFFASAMSVGALGPEAHRVLAIAMNRLGSRSNSGEGGEEPARYGAEGTAAGTSSQTKQVASARFGVTPGYLLSASELQIKIAQGSKPGEGGQLPAAKVVDHIARLRYAQPGTALISPPPHHDIYSIEDLAQLVYDLRSLHPAARVNVKLVASGGVGIIAAGVVKAGATAIQISGHDGGTGASPRGSIKHAGLPWEIGLLDAHRTLAARGVRHRVVLQTDGGLKTGFDVAMAAALGADEYGFGTAALVALGCVMARQCHANTCPVGVATQRPDLRARFAGTPEQVITYLTMVAEDVRAQLAALGLPTLDALIGRVDLLEPRDAEAASRLDLHGLLAPIAWAPPLAAEDYADRGPAGGSTLNGRLAARAARALGRHALLLEETIRNTDRTVGATLAGRIARVYGDAGIPDTPIRLSLTGHAGQSLGAFAVPGLEMTLTGDANDGVGKGMHGGLIAIRPPAGTPLAEQVLIGNSALYGATGGALYVAGRAGERFAVRNGGATAVVEGIGHHGCEYMTGGTVAVLGPTGLNFGAGMTGGVAYVLDMESALAGRVNSELVEAGVLAEDDETRLHALLVAHHEATGSAAAARLLASWPAAVSDFRVVYPKGDPARAQTTCARLLGPALVPAGPAALAAAAGHHDRR